MTMGEGFGKGAAAAVAATAAAAAAAAVAAANSSNSSEQQILVWNESMALSSFCCTDYHHACFPHPVDTPSKIAVILLHVFRLDGARKIHACTLLPAITGSTFVDVDVDVDVDAAVASKADKG